MIASSLIVAVLCVCFGGIARIAGAALFSGIVAYTVIGIIESRRSPQESAETEKTLSILLGSVAVIGGLATLVTGSKLLLSSAVFLSSRLGIPDSVVALTVVAVGTSLPELATSVLAAAKGERDIAIGNVVGSNIFNLLGIMGLSALLAPIKCPGIGIVDISVMVFTAFILWPIMKTGHRISRAEGCALLLVYVAYTAWLIHSA